MLDWRATPDERREQLPGDELVPEARSVSTHAITIRAPAACVWPWLIQMGCDRAGFYSHDHLDNAGRPSADRILPELQDTKVGDVLPSRPGSPHGFEVLRMEACRIFLLRERHDAARLVVRAHGVIRPAWLGLLVNAVMGPAHVVMQRRQLLNLRRRAEQLARAEVARGRA